MCVYATSACVRVCVCVCVCVCMCVCACVHAWEREAGGGGGGEGWDGSTVLLNCLCTRCAAFGFGLSAERRGTEVYVCVIDTERVEGGGGDMLSCLVVCAESGKFLCECVCVCVRDRGGGDTILNCLMYRMCLSGDFVCVCVCVRARARARVCVYVCVLRKHRQPVRTCSSFPCR